MIANMKNVIVFLIYQYIRFFPLRLGKIPLLRVCDYFKLFNNLERHSTFGKNIKVLLKLDDWIQQLVYFFGSYKLEENESELWCKLSNRSAVLARENNQNAKIYSFEPAPEIFKRLLLNIKLNNYDIDCVNKGVSNYSGTAKFFLSGNKNTGMSSLRTPESFSGEMINVDIVSIDSFCLESGIEIVDLVKIDVEGNEQNVLIGMKEIIDKSKPIIFIEILEKHLNRFGNSRIELYEFIKKFDYQIYEYNHTSGLSQVINPIDVGLAICCHKSKLNLILNSSLNNPI